MRPASPEPEAKAGAPRVLLVEDEPAQARGLSDSLRANGFEVTVSADGERGLDVASSGTADLILLDVMLPKINGYEICRAVRAQGIDVPILMLTAKGQEQDVILGLNLGADDYITKPFRTGELIARARAFLRRRGPARTSFRFGDCDVDFSRAELRRAGERVDLTAIELKMLHVFLQAQGRIMTRAHVIDEVWGRDVFVTDRVVDTHIVKLRRKIEPDPAEPTHIVSVRGIGYRFDV